MSTLGASLDERWLREELGPDSGFERIVVAESVASTNDVARELALGGAPAGTVVLVDRQTGGRGRLGRTWHSAGGLGLYLSVLLRPAARACELTRWTLGAAAAAAEACRLLGAVEVTIRWPNDLLAGGRKLGGVLAEARNTGETAELVIGLGINVGHGADDFPAALSTVATSLRLACGVTPERERLAALYLRRLATVDRDLARGDWDAVARRWAALAPAASGAAVHVVSTQAGEGAVAGITAGIDEAGALLVRRADGRVLALRQSESVLPREG